MARILAFAGSNSSTSINYELVKYTTSLIEHHEIHLLELSNYPFPMFGVDRENDLGFPDAIQAFLEDIRKSDALVVGVNEHNSGPSAYFKNLVDWLSRIDRKFLDGKKILLLSTSPGKRGASSSLEYTASLFPRFGGEIIAAFSLPSYKDNFKPLEGIQEDALAANHQQALQQFLESIA